VRERVAVVLDTARETMMGDGRQGAQVVGGVDGKDDGVCARACASRWQERERERTGRWRDEGDGVLLTSEALARRCAVMASVVDASLSCSSTSHCGGTLYVTVVPSLVPCARGSEWEE